MDADAAPQKGSVGELPVLTVTEKQKKMDFLVFTSLLLSSEAQL